MSGYATNQDFGVGSGEAGCATGSVMRNRDTPFFDEIAKNWADADNAASVPAPRRLSVKTAV